MSPSHSERKRQNNGVKCTSHSVLASLLSEGWHQSSTQVAALHNNIDWVPGIAQSLRCYQGNRGITKKKKKNKNVWSYPRTKESVLLTGSVS